MYIEELAELISASAADMSSLSVKPDKCAILQETVNQIRRIRDEDAGGALSETPPPPPPPQQQPQQALDAQVLGTFLLEALDGFLFVVNADGKTEYVSDNVTHFLRYRPAELVGKSVYNVIHHGDHARFSSSLMPCGIGNTRHLVQKLKASS